MIRAVRPTDVVALAAFQAHTRTTEITAPAWPHLAPQHGLSLARLLLQALLYPAASRGAWISLRQGRVQGFVIGCVQARGLVWGVERLAVDDSAVPVARELLEHLSVRAACSGARRIFLRAGAGIGMEVARRSGFERYATSTQYALRPPYITHPDRLEARRRLRRDDFPLFQLYNAAVPLSVRSAEAMTYEEWAALYRARQAWSPPVLGGQRQYVWELGGSLVGWMQLSYGRRAQQVAMLTHPKYDELTERLLHFAVTQAEDRPWLYATARSYQQVLMSALERAGFRPLGEVECYVRHLASRVSEPRLVPAKIVGGY